ncbi:MAG: alanine racemase [Clostridiales bacterium]|nr:alanine racemase [Clostridiales bacterium]
MPQQYPSRPARIEVDLAALRHNVSVMRTQVSPSLLMAVVKADAFGHGIIPIAHAALAAGAEKLAVATVDEAIKLRREGIGATILNLGWTGPNQIEQAVRDDIAMTVFDYDNAALIAAAAAKQHKNAVIHVKLDTGLSRLGFPTHSLDFTDIKRLFSLPNLIVEGIFSHFACADAPDLSHAEQQLSRFLAFTDTLKAQGINIPLRHIANSPATVIFPASWLDMVRPGIMMYGNCPSEHLRNVLPLKLVMRVLAQVAQVHTLQPGDTVGYSCRWQASRPSRIATLPLGYADGVPRLLGNRGFVLINGCRAPIVGSVTMDLLMVDITDIPAARAGDEAVIMGSQGAESITPEEIADHAQTITDEVVSRFGQRLPKLYIGYP